MVPSPKPTQVASGSVKRVTRPLASVVTAVLRVPDGAGEVTLERRVFELLPQVKAYAQPETGRGGCLRAPKHISRLLEKVVRARSRLNHLDHA